MVLIMTMTPLHMTEHGHTLTEVGIVCPATRSGCTLSTACRAGSRTASGPSRRSSRDGVLADAAVLAALSPPEGGCVLLVALFLLGLGWNFGFVAGSALLSEQPRAPRADAGPGLGRRARSGVRGGREPRLGR